MEKSPPDIKIAPESFGSEVSDHDYIIWVRFFGLQYAEHEDNLRTLDVLRKKPPIEKLSR